MTSTERLARSMGLDPKEFAEYQRTHPADGSAAAARAGCPSPSAPTPITPTAEERAIFERARQSTSVAALKQLLASSRPPAPSGRTATMKMISRGLFEGTR
jgi:hypothetical protein